MSELEFLGALHVELSRRSELRPEHHPHELFQASTVEALLAGAFDGDVTLEQLLEHGDLGLGTLNGLDGELIVLEGQAWKANLDCTLAQPRGTVRTPYAVVTEFAPGDPIALTEPLGGDDLEQWLRARHQVTDRPDAIRVDGQFKHIHVRSVPRQRRPYPSLATAIAHQHVCELDDVSGTMVGFRFPDPLDGLEMAGFHLHFVTDDRTRGGHVLSYRVLEGELRIDEASDLHVELPPTVRAPAHGTHLDEAEISLLESDSRRPKTGS
jgi:acetolactate decarboxylase